MDSGFSVSVNCSDLTITELKELNLIMSVSAMVCTLIIILVLFSLIIYKRAFGSTFQRLYFCLMIETLVAEIAFALSIERQFSHNYQHELCVGVGFLINWSDIMVYISSYEIILYLLYLVITKIRGISWHIRCKSCQILAETVYLLIPAILPLPFVLPPYFKGLYGSAGAWCWIMSIDKNCKQVGALDQVLAYSINEAVGFVGIFVCAIFTTVYCKLASDYKETKKLLRQTLLLLCFQLLQISIVTIPFGIRVYAITSHVYQDYGLWIVKALLEPFSKLITQLGCFLCFYPIKQMFCFPFMKKLRQSRKNETRISRLATVQAASVQYSAPSSTFFEVPHPEADENSFLRDCAAEQSSYQSVTSTVTHNHRYLAKILQ